MTSPPEPQSLDESLFDRSTLDRLFPATYSGHPLPALCQAGVDTLADLMPERDLPRVPGWTGADGYERLLERYERLPAETTADPAEVVAQLSRDFLPGAVSWRCPELQYNLGAAVNVVSAALYAIALDLNVYLINDGLAGNAIVAEQAVAKILLDLAGVAQGQGHGLFTFGGTGTIAYALKVGLRKAAPASVRRGRPRDLRVAITEDAHFSHTTAADWLGIGSDELLVVPADASRRSRVDCAEQLLRRALSSGYVVPTILINGGTTYDHAIDDIPAFVALRDALVREFGLDYSPHVHVDSVVGWVWLAFRDYDFAANRLELSDAAADAIARQYERVSALCLADSWGADFHKGAGACPVDCSIFVANDAGDIVRLAKGELPQAGTHQLADELSAVSPADYTLETSRAGGKALAALGALHSLGRDGYRRAVGNLIENTLLFRELIAEMEGARVLNDYALGYQTMVRLYAPGALDGELGGQELIRDDAAMAAYVATGNAYMKAFFTWDNDTRMNVNGGGVVYSYTRHFVTTPSGPPISGLKFYPTSPRITRQDVRDTIALLEASKAAFDSQVGPFGGE